MGQVYCQPNQTLFLILVIQYHKYSKLADDESGINTGHHLLLIFITNISCLATVSDTMCNSQ